MEAEVEGGYPEGGGVQQSYKCQRECDGKAKRQKREGRKWRKTKEKAVP